MKAAHAWTAAGATVFFSVLLLAIAPRPSVWESWRPATCMPTRCFCEAVRPQLVRQTMNAVSGLGFVGVGILILFSSVARSVRSQPAPATRLMLQPVYSGLFATASLLIGFGTTFYHASLTFWGQTTDVLGMYLIATFLVLYNSSRLWRMTPVMTAMIYMSTNAVLLAGLIFVPGARRYAFAALVLLALGLERAARRKERVTGNRRLLQLAVAALALGFLIWIVDITKVACWPDSWLQGHALWHLSGATSLWLVFLYYRSAMPRDDFGSAER